jgi:amino acid permease
MSDNLKNEQTEKKTETNTILWILCVILWFLFSFITGASDFIQILINMIVPAVFAIVPIFIISLFTKKFYVQGVLIVTILIFVLSLIPKFI